MDSRRSWESAVGRWWFGLRPASSVGRRVLKPLAVIAEASGLFDSKISRVLPSAIDCATDSNTLWHGYF